MQICSPLQSPFLFSQFRFTPSSPRHLQGTEAIRVKAVISAAASDHV